MKINNNQMYKVPNLYCMSYTYRTIAQVILPAKPVNIHQKQKTAQGEFNNKKCAILINK